jgi:hypothetical protein
LLIIIKTGRKAKHYSLFDLFVTDKEKEASINVISDQLKNFVTDEEAKLAGVSAPYK